MEPNTTPTTEEAAAAPITHISIDDVAKVEIKVGLIVAAEKVANTDKLLKLTVDFSEATPRQIVSGIALYFPDPATLVNVKTTFVTNLQPRTIKGLESNGMLFALGSGETFALLIPHKDVPVGSGAH